MIKQRTLTVLFFLSLCGFLCLAKSVQASDYVSCLAEKLQGITHDTAVKAITEACQAQYANNTASKPTRTPAKALIDGRYRDNLNGTDTKTNLIWMRCSLGQQKTGSTCVGLSMEMDWNDALKTAMSFSYAGQSNWRVPIVDELDTLVQCSAGRAPSARPNGKFVADTDGSCHSNEFSNPKININAFPNTLIVGFFWSSSPNTYHSGYAWGVYFDSGYVGFNNGGAYGSNRGECRHVRLVRAGQ